MSNIVAIIQARMGSSRLPGKVMADICGKPMLEHIIERVRYAKLVNEIVVATSDRESDDEIEKFCKKINCLCFRGSETNVLERFYGAAKFYNADIIIRLTADNALVDYNLLDEAINYYNNSGYDYLRYREGLPLGMACEIFSFQALEKSAQLADNEECLEHVTPFMYKNNNLFKAIIAEKQGEDNSDLRWTVDTEVDFKLITEIYSYFNRNNLFTYTDILNAYKENKNWNSINKDIKQNKIKYSGKGGDL